MRALRRTSLLLVALTLAGVTGGCAKRVAVFDLVAGLPLADIRVDTTTLALGEPESRAHLGSGWIYQGFERREGMYGAASGDASVRIRVTQPGDIAVRLSGRPLEDRGAVGRRLRLMVNGEEIGRQRIRYRDAPYTFAVPESALAAGVNELNLRLVPPDPELDELASMAWDSMEILREESRPVELPRATASGEGLILPAGTRVDYHLHLPEQATLEIGEVEFGAAGPGTLRVMVEQDREAPVVVASRTEAGGGLDVDLAPFASRVVRLSLEAAVPDALGASAGDVILGSALITVPEAGRVAESGASLEAPSTESSPAARGNVLLYVVDSLRADRLGVYGHDRDVSPNLDRFAQRATVFETAISQSSWTRASMASVMTGLWPLAHDTNGRADVLAAEALTLAEMLNERGYETMAIAQNPNVFAQFGFDQGFEIFTELLNKDASDALAEIRGWLDSRDPERPFFLWAHTIDPHTPYTAPGDHLRRYDEPAHGDLDMDKPPSKSRVGRMSAEELDRTVSHVLARYDAEIYFSDLIFGELVELLEERQLLDETLLIFVSDHGEEFLDHGKWEHGRDLHFSSLEVPLVIRAPGQERGTRVESTVQQIDLLPTIVDFTGLEPVDGLVGRSLMPYLGTGIEEDLSSPIYSYLHLDGRPFASVFDGDWKLIERYPEEGLVVSQLFDLREDPEEALNRALDRPILTRYLSLQLEARLAMGKRLTTHEAEMDEEMVNALKALGYLD